MSKDAILSASTLSTGPAESVQHPSGPFIVSSPAAVIEVVVDMPPPYIDSHRCEA
ncbi:hypothetical protein MICRO80W_610004 [Micrococcus luteus]|nr:hypothetical protein MICRO80W_610004 [Micrococcus luteus]